jgi:1,4-dihydroxy-2-naphthoate octaprenyltransferase
VKTPILVTSSNAVAAAPGGRAKPSSFTVWWLASRPKTLPAAATPVLVGTACAAAAGGFRFAPALGALLGALLLQIAANFANDVFDFEQGADTAARSGPTRVVQAGWVSPREMRVALAAVLGLAFLIGAYLVSVSGPVLIAIGVVSAVAAVAYTGGPYPLGYHGLGDLCVFAFFGVVAVGGTAFVQLGHVPALAWLASLPVGCLATAILVVNNVRDADTDRLAGKRTLVVRLGRSFGIWEYRALTLLPYLLPSYWAVRDGRPIALLPCLSAPLAIALCRALQRERGPALNRVLARTALLLLLFGALFTVSIALGAGSWPTPP